MNMYEYISGTPNFLPFENRFCYVNFFNVLHELMLQYCGLLTGHHDHQTEILCKLLINKKIF